MCSSVHKAKGLETQRVFTIEETFKSRFGATLEEENIRYVAVTRSQNELILVQDKKEF
jgi:superfamily I DNA/RNA helicase